MLENRFDFGTEDKTPVLMIKIEWLHARAITRQHQPFPVGIPQSDSVITFNVVNKVEAALFVEMKNSFGIRAGSVNVAAPLQTFSQRGVVVNFTVENKPDSIGTAVHRLVTGLG